jgi:hypothetical protein
MHSTINYAASMFSAQTAVERSPSDLVGGLTTLAASLNRVNLSTGELAVTRATRATAAGAAAGSITGRATSLAALLAGLMGVNLATCEL